MIFAYIALGALAALLALMAARAASTRKAPPPGTLDPARLQAFAGVEDKLSALIRVPTVSRFDPSEEDGEAFERLRRETLRLFPLVGERLLKPDVGDRAMLFEWPGSDASLAPVILTAHFDVVPPGDESLWRRSPFSGAVVDGYVHGRGAQDVKIMMACALEATERLLSDGFVPKRTVYLAFGGDEETGGVRGAASIAALLAERGVKASFLLDEGGFVASGMLSFADRPLALVGVAEKGYVDVAIGAKGKGGHASMPPRHTAAGLVAKAVAMSESNPFPARITATLARFLSDLSPYAPFGYRLLFRNLFVTGPLVKLAFSASPTTNALVRTTTAATMLSGSDKENVLPDKARAILNVRVLPGSDVASAMARLDAIASKAGATAEFAHHGHAVEPLPESPVDHEGYRALEACIREVFPEAGTVPFMFTAGTDTKHYVGLVEAMYRFEPIMQSPEDLAGVHGADERVSVENVRRCCMFYETLIRGL
ncbi:MAG: M20/M25/M40 family metallo-hydrolase [Spirochaetes bacterium]|nr:M20/M25/M40 family metallo-hydrolase [Spirochaetota bacterium]MBU1080715.1 M20/M25/M40 family metallo-hydrolase [Spirochaetota bacterium]